MSTTNQHHTERQYTNESLMPLENSDLKRLCPAIFAGAPREDVSDRYGFVSTIEMVEAMRKAGFVPTQVNSYMRRNDAIRAFTKHMIRFRAAGKDVKRLVVGDSVAQIVLINSHDRSSQFHLMGGIWRLLCSNGLMVSDSSVVEPIIVRHTTSAIDGLLDATGRLVKAQKQVFEFVDTMRDTKLTDKQQRLFAESALAIRPERAGVIDASQLLRVRRDEDIGDDLWHVYNRVQENMMKGGTTGVTANNRQVVTRPITSINADEAINRGMWTLAMEAISKAAASAKRATGKKAAATANADEAATTA